MTMEDRRAHERLTVVEQWVDKHEQRHNEFEEALRRNTELTQAIEVNTRELVILYRGANNVRTFFIWASPIAAAIAGVWAFFSWIY